MKSKSSPAIVIAAILALAVGVFILWKFKHNPPQEGTPIRKIAFVVPTMENPFFVSMTNAAKAKAEDLGNIQVLVQAPPNLEDALAQSQIVENLITQKVDAICIVPTNSDSIIPVLKKANDAGIPVINIDNKINAELAAKANLKIGAYIGSDNYQGGVLAAKYVIERVSGDAKIAILEGVSGNDAAIKRKAGFVDTIKKQPRLQIVASQVANWNREQAHDIFKNIIHANPEIRAVFACNDEMALGAFAALAQSEIKKENIIILGFDATPEAVKAVKSGTIDATVGQMPELMGNEGIHTAISILDRKPFNPVVSTDLRLTTK